jgi:C terminal of Calcineurin-like phosphoesterase/N terminal of Calcineurin-like phosphoesterase/Calcineurin-like phosphoesterase
MATFRSNDDGPFETHDPFSVTRRSFIATGVAAGAALILPPILRADPYRDISRRVPRRFSPVAIRGHVRSGTRGLADVSVSDGFSVVRTGADGEYSILADPRSDFVHVSLPSGYRIPLQSVGTANVFQRIVSGPSGEQTIEFDLHPDGNANDRYSFLALADPQTQTEWEMSRFHQETVVDVRETLAGLDTPAAFGVSCGDIMFDHLDLYPQYENAVSQMGVPFFQVVGNHDLDTESLTDPGSTSTFSSYFGPAYYSFNRGDIHFVVLDDVFWHGAGYIGHIDADQLAWLRQDLSFIESGRTVIVISHIPGLSTGVARNKAGSNISNSVTNREALYRLLEPYEAHMITGHTHESEHVFEGGIHEHVLGTACGAWWSDDICYDGTPNGYGVFDISGSSVSWRYKATGRKFDHQIRAYLEEATGSTPATIRANVWDWDPEWKIDWYENGIRRDRMERRTGKDPLAEERFAGPDLPAHRKWVDPVITDHLFAASGFDTGSKLSVEATDREGRSYVADVR